MMGGGKYIIASAENPTQVKLRNILNPSGYMFIGNVSEPVALIRIIRSYQPDFVVIDFNMQLGELRSTILTIDSEMLCACIIIGQESDVDIIDILHNTKVVSVCPLPLNKDVLLQTVEMSLLNFKRVYELSRKLREAAENLELRKVLDKAKLILMKENNITEDEAYRVIRKKSMDTRMSLKDIAQVIISNNMNDIKNEIKG